jgi:CRISPR/Cas system CMR subunit Cmr4 (Cas7 group RAMP superfamily)
MATYQLKIHLLSETTFGRGDGLAGEVDQEIVHDRSGFPYLRGRTLKGVLSEECDGIVAVLPAQHQPTFDTALKSLFGIGGSTTQTQARWQYGDALLPEQLRTAVAQQVTNKKRTVNEVLDSLTTIRQQTAIDIASGTPDEGSLRAVRVIIRELVFTSSLTADVPSDEQLQLLAAGCRALRHLGAGRTRGRGHVRCTLHNAAGEDITAEQLDLFANKVQA